MRTRREQGEAKLRCAGVVFEFYLLVEEEIVGVESGSHWGFDGERW